MLATIFGSVYTARAMTNNSGLRFPMNLERNHLIFLAIIISLVTKYPFLVASSGFPLGDGGLFAEIIDQLRTHGYRWPATVYFNGENIPLTYPPLAFYLGAFIGDLFGVPTLTVLRWVPLIMNTICVALFVVLASLWVEDKLQVLFCAIVFPLAPLSFLWLISGGGMTRSLGYIFSLLSAIQATRAVQCAPEKRFSALALCSIVIALGAMSHLEGGIIGFSGALAVFVQKEDQRQTIKDIVIVGILSALFSSPWLGSALATHGPAPFRYASAAGNLNDDGVKGLLFSILSLPSYVLKGGFLYWLAAMGGTFLILKKSYFLPLWLFLILFLTPRHGSNMKMVPVIIMASYGFLIVVNFFDERLMQLFSKISQKEWNCKNLCKIVGIFIVLTASTDRLYSYMRKIPPYFVPRSNLMIMNWIKNNPKLESGFVIMTNNNDFFGWDFPAEWFYYLTKKNSLTSPQGFEWLPYDLFFERRRIDSIIKGQLRIDHTRVARILKNSIPYTDYVLALAPGVRPNFGGLKNSGQFAIVNIGPQHVLFEKKTADKKANSLQVSK